MRLLHTSRRKLLKLAVFGIGVLLVASGLAAQNNRPDQSRASSALQKTISDAAAKYKIPGIAVAWIEQGQLRSLEVYGVRDVKSGEPVTPNTVFEAGSLGEPIYAYTVLLRAVEKRFDIGAPLAKYAPPPYVRDLDLLSSSFGTESLYDPEIGQISAIRVMNHTSGMPEWARARHLHMQSRPGEKWAYSNEGYVYLQHAMEQATGESFGDMVLHGAFAPTGMARSSFTWREEYSADSATGYDSSGAPALTHHYSKPIASATLYTTIQDYARFVMRLLASAPSQRAHELAVSMMLSPTVAVDSANSLSWGMGVGLEKGGNDLYLVHRGNNPGFQCFVLASRKSRDGVVVFTNSGNGLEVVPEILAATLGGNHPALKSAFFQAK